MAVKGVFASDKNIQGTRKGDFASAVLQYDPTGSAPLLALSSGMPSQGAADTIITWFEENRITGRVNITTDIALTTSGTVDDASAVVAGQIYIVEANGEYLYVESVSGAVITFSRGFGGTTPVDVDGSGTPVPIQRIGNAHEEGSGKPTSFANVGSPIFNYMEIFRNSWDATGTAKAVEFLTGDVVAKNKRDASTFHAEDIERSLLWGKKAIGVQNGKPFRSMDGIITQITARQTVSGAVTSESTNTKWSDLDAFLQAVFSNNIKGKPNERIAFCDNQVLSVIGRIAVLNSVIDLATGDTEFGLKITKWITPYGTITLMTHPLMNEMQAFRGALYVLHPGAIQTRYLRMTHEDKNDSDGTRAGADADFGVFTTEMSVEYRGAKTGGIYTGMSTPAAEA